MTLKKFTIFFFLPLLLIGCSVPETTLSSDPVSIAQRQQSIFITEGSQFQNDNSGDGPTATIMTLRDIATQTELAASGADRGITKASSTPAPSDTPNPTNTLAPGETPSITNTTNPYSATNTHPPPATNTTKPTATNSIKNTSAPTSTSSYQQPTDTKKPTNPVAPTDTPKSSSQNTETYTPTHTQPPPATSTNTSAPAACIPSGNSAFENQVVSLINAERAAESLPPLTIQSQLTSAARIHSQDMACNNFFSHTSPTTGSLSDRVTTQGYSYSWAGENIAAGYGSASAAVEGWMNSAGHKANILDPNFTQIGVGYAYWGSSTYGSYITVVFASP